ncbi:hypothetical protein QJQ45_021257, partial [Haematococcus lacustris]
TRPSKRSSRHEMAVQALLCVTHDGQPRYSSCRHPWKDANWPGFGLMQHWEEVKWTATSPEEQWVLGLKAAGSAEPAAVSHSTQHHSAAPAEAPPTPPSRQQQGAGVQQASMAGQAAPAAPEAPALPTAAPALISGPEPHLGHAPCTAHDLAAMREELRCKPHHHPWRAASVLATAWPDADPQPHIDSWTQLKGFTDRSLEYLPKPLVRRSQHGVGVLAIIPLPFGTAEAHVQVKMQELVFHGLDSACIASITADSAAVNMGEYGGVVTRMSKLLQSHAPPLSWLCLLVHPLSSSNSWQQLQQQEDPHGTWRQYASDIRAMAVNGDPGSPALRLHLEQYYLASPISNAPVESLLQRLKHGGGRYMELPALLQLMSLRTCKEAMKTVDVHDLQQRMGQLRAEVRRKEYAAAAAQRSAKAERQITDAAHKVGRVAAAHALALGGHDFSHTTVEEAKKMTGKQLQTYLQFHKQEVHTSWRVPKLLSHVCTHIREKLAAAMAPQQQLTPAGTTPELAVPAGAPPQQQQQVAAASTSRKRGAPAANKSRAAKQGATHNSVAKRASAARLALSPRKNLHLGLHGRWSLKDRSPQNMRIPTWVRNCGLVLTGRCKAQCAEPGQAVERLLVLEVRPLSEAATSAGQATPGKSGWPRGVPTKVFDSSGARGRPYVADVMAPPTQQQAHASCSVGAGMTLAMWWWMCPQAVGSGAVLPSTLGAAGSAAHPAPPLSNMGSQGQQQPWAQQVAAYGHVAAGATMTTTPPDGASYPLCDLQPELEHGAVSGEPGLRAVGAQLQGSKRISEEGSLGPSSRTGVKRKAADAKPDQSPVQPPPKYLLRAGCLALHSQRHSALRMTRHALPALLTLPAAPDQGPEEMEVAPAALPESSAPDGEPVPDPIDQTHGLSRLAHTAQLTWGWAASGMQVAYAHPPAAAPAPGQAGCSGQDVAVSAMWPLNALHPGVEGAGGCSLGASHDGLMSDAAAPPCQASVEHGTAQQLPVRSEC